MLVISMAINMLCIASTDGRVFGAPYVSRVPGIVIQIRSVAVTGGTSG